MKYRVHVFEMKGNNLHNALEDFLNKLDGEVISIVPNVKPVFRPMGATAKTDKLLIIEKIE